MDLPRFVGGAVGMVGYDWVRFVEDIPDANPDAIGLPDLWFVFPETVVVYDNVQHTALIVRHAHVLPGDDLKEARKREIAAIEAVIGKLRGELKAQLPVPAAESPMELKRSMEAADYHAIVEKAKEYIAAGDVFQVVLGMTNT